MAKFILRDVSTGLIVPVAAILIWQLFSSMGWVNPLVLPSPLAVVRKWFEYLAPGEAYAGGNWLMWLLSGELIRDTISSMYRVVAGFVVGAGLALPLGLSLGSSQRVYAWLNPLIQVLRPIPPIAYIPLSILWFGVGDTQNQFIIFLGIFFPILLNTIAGVKSVEHNLVRAARCLGGGEAAVLRRVVLPAALPQIVTGIRIGLGFGWMALVAAELIGASSGLGFLINDARTLLRTDIVIVGMIAIGLVGLALDLLVREASRRALPWSRSMQQ